MIDPRTVRIYAFDVLPMIGRTFLELPKDQDTFEEFVRDLFEHEYGFKLSILGKGPKSQDGVDIIGTIPDSEWTNEFRKLGLDHTVAELLLGIQAKVRAKTLSFSAIKSDCDRARKSKLNIAAFVVVTSASRNTTLLKNLDEYRQQIPLFKHIYFRQDIQTLYIKYPDLWERYHPLGPRLSQLPILHERIAFSVDRFMELGRILLESGQYDAGIYAADSVIRIKPEQLDAWIMKCSSFLSAGQPHNLLSSIEEAETSIGEIPVLVWFKAVAHLQLGDDDLAAEGFMHAYELSEEPEEAIIVGYVSSLIHTGELSKAEHLVKVWVEKKPNDVVWSGQLATIYLRQGKYGDAVQIFETVKDSVIGTGHQGWYGYALKEIGRLRDGYPHIEAAFMKQISGPFPNEYKATLYSELGALSVQMNESERAREYFDRSESLFDSFVGLWLGRAALHMQEGNLTAADSALERALAINPRNGYVHARVARLRIRRNRIVDACESYRKAIKNVVDLKDRKMIEKAASLDFYFVAYRKQQEYSRTRDISVLKLAKCAAICSMEFVENVGAQEILRFINEEKAT